jgi:hypothetical protein
MKKFYGVIKMQYEELKNKMNILLEEYYNSNTEIAEKCSLSDKISFWQEANIKQSDVKIALKELLDILKCDSNNTDEDRERVDWLQIKSRAKEIFGERLL